MTKGSILGICIIQSALLFFTFFDSIAQIDEIQATDFLRIKLININNYTDEAIVRFLPDATRGFDPNYDAFKLQGSVLNVFTMPDTTLSLAINSLPFPQEIDSVSIRFNGGFGDFKFAISGFNTFTTSLVAVLKDKFTGINHVISNTDTISFNVSTDPGTYGKRFSLLYFFPTNINQILYENRRSGFFAKPGEDLLFLKTEQFTEYQWHGMDGRMVLMDSKTVPKLANGLYILNVRGKHFKVLVQK